MKKFILYTALLLSVLTTAGCAWLNEPIEVPALSAVTAPEASAPPEAGETPAVTPHKAPAQTPKSSAAPSGTPAQAPAETPTASAAAMATQDAAAIAKAIKPVSPEDARKLIGQKGVVLLDVRDQYEYDGGHIAGAVLLPYDAIAEGAPGLPEDKGSTIIVYCRSGRRSAIAAETLAKLGYTHILDLGSIQAWPYGTVTDSQDDPQTAGQ
jgi:phage shock protein E